MAKGTVDLDDRVLILSLFPACAFLYVMVKQINFYAIGADMESVFCDSAHL